MKKLLLVSFFGILACMSLNAQDDHVDHGAIEQGQWIIEINTGSWTTGNTAFSLTAIDGNTAWSAGAEVGYFIKENLAIKAGLGYSDSELSDGSFAYKIGAKYYIDSRFPIGVDYTGVSSDGNDASWVGVQGGYAWFVSQNVSIEPTLRYNITLDDMKADSAFQALIGFAFHF
uniref:hypothetical protein n=1 Tax=Mariniflexile sp. TaxID=1979402 RepID=UPI004048D7EF